MPVITAAPPSGLASVREPSPDRQIDPLRVVLFPARAFLALGWARAGVEKLIDASWWDGSELRSFVSSHEENRLPFLDDLAALIGDRVSIALAVLVVLAEFAIAMCFVTTKRFAPALGAACLLNVAFVAFGAVTPSAFYLVLQLTLLLSLYVRQPNQSIGTQRLPAAACLAAAIAMTPFMTTLQPHAVIDDPAIMLATLAGLTAATLMINTIDPSETD